MAPCCLLPPAPATHRRRPHRRVADSEGRRPPCSSSRRLGQRPGAPPPPRPSIAPVSISSSLFLHSVVLDPSPADRLRSPCSPFRWCKGGVEKALGVSKISNLRSFDLMGFLRLHTPAMVEKGLGRPYK